MTLIMKSEAYVRGDLIAANMHRERKRVFVDLLKWDVPIVDGEFEIDQFDDSAAVYLVSAESDCSHRGSLRLLPTTRPHILGSLFPELCDGPVPTGPNVYEITRACFSPRLRASERIRVRNQLVTAAVELALFNGIDTFTCLATAGMYSQVLSLGWMCEPLGLPRLVGDALTGALRISVTRETPRLLQQAGTYTPSKLELATPALLAA
jgi:N-acyl-L-homoserine lactone synthetase